MRELRLEDIEVGMRETSEPFTVERSAIIEFARQWDPQPFHLDEAAAAGSVFGGLSACAAHSFAILSRLGNTMEGRVVVLAGLGTEKLELKAPVRPGDRLRLVRTFVAKRPSRSKPDRGIVDIDNVLINQDDEVVLATLGKVMVESRSRRGDHG
jgi:acyl dehydratase